MVDSGRMDSTLANALAEDLELLARLHGREADEALLRDLAASPAADWFSLALSGAEAAAGLELLDQYFRDDFPAGNATELLAVEYADFYLTFGKRVAPNESYWRSEDHIERQDPMFAVREWYAHYGLKAADWRKLADDHLVSELAFLAYLLRDGRAHALQDAGRFMDRHLLTWSRDFFSGIAERAETRFYAGLAVVSETVLQNIRNCLERLTGETRKAFSQQDASSSPVSDAPFVPGVAAGW